MVYITGDTHGDNDYDKLHCLYDFNVTYDDTLIILGDAGICWIGEITQEYIELYEKLHITIIYVDGNHENFDYLETLPVVEYHGALMHKVSDHIYHVMRGEIMNIEGFSMLCIGGAKSMDKYLRKEHYSWWPQEDISVHDIDNARENLKKCDYRVDLVLTHCCDSYTLKALLRFPPDRNTEMLNFIDEEVAYRYWMFGHYHQDATLGDKKCCLYQSVLCVNDLMKAK